MNYEGEDSKAETGSEAEEAGEAWKAIKSKIKNTWSKLSSDEVDSMENHFQEILAILQGTYGLAKVKIAQEEKNLENSFRVVWQESKKNKIFGALSCLALASLLLTTGYALTAATHNHRKKR